MKSFKAAAIMRDKSTEKQVKVKFSLKLNKISIESLNLLSDYIENLAHLLKGFRKY
jgi:hypothetical protein